MLKTPQRLSALCTDIDVLAVKCHFWAAAAADVTEAGLNPVVLSSYKGITGQDPSVGITLMVKRLNFDKAALRFPTFNMSHLISNFFF